MTASTRHVALWLMAGGTFVAVFGLLGYYAARPNSLTAGIATGGLSGAMVLGAGRLWYGRSRGPVPAAEYLAAVWALSYIALIAITAAGRRISLVDSIVISPPLGFVPLLVRTLLGDEGDPTGPGRAAAFQLHRALGWLHTAAGVLAALSLFFVFVAPLQLVPGVLHLRAAHEYRPAREHARPGQ